MGGLYITVGLVGALAIVLPYLLYLIFPTRRIAFGRSAWFAFAPLILGISGFVALAIFVLSAGNNLDPQASTGLTGSAMVTTFNLFNGYRSVVNWWKNRR